MLQVDYAHTIAKFGSREYQGHNVDNNIDNNSGHTERKHVGRDLGSRTNLWIFHRDFWIRNHTSQDQVWLVKIF